MIHPHTELRFINEEIGHGVVATKFIPAGTITWVHDKLDRTFTKEEYNAMAPLYKTILDTYTFRNNSGKYVLCWDHGRYVNHSFKSNCLSTAYDFEIAIRDIHPGEQLTDDYGYLNIAEPFRGIDEGTKRKVVYPDDLLRYYRVWDQKIEKALPKLNKVEQPLKGLLEDGLWETLEKITGGKEPMASILSNYFHQE
ncbi:SET domain-containing protein [Aegicerativicinus sediminis]